MLRGIFRLDKDLGDPFAPDHWYSRSRPNHKPKPLPEPDPAARLTGVRFGDAVLLLPIPAGSKVNSRESTALGRKTATVGIEEGQARIQMAASAIHRTPLGLPAEVRKGLHKLDLKYGLSAMPRIIREFERVKKLPKFDLLLAIVRAHVNDFAPTVPLERRVVNLYLFCLKHEFAPRPHVPFQHWAGKRLRCLVIGPEGAETQDKASETDGRKLIEVQFAFRGYDQVVRLLWSVPRSQADELTVGKVLSFLANCRLKAAP